MMWTCNLHKYFWKSVNIFSCLISLSAWDRSSPPHSSLQTLLVYIWWWVSSVYLVSITYMSAIFRTRHIFVIIAFAHRSIFPGIFWFTSFACLQEASSFFIKGPKITSISSLTPLLTSTAVTVNPPYPYVVPIISGVVV